MATKYTANIDYPTHYFRAWMTYTIADEDTWTVSVDYGIALHDSYVTQSWENMGDRYVAVSSSGAKTTDTGWERDSTYLSGSGSNWWHKTGSTTISVAKTSSAQSLTLKIWGKVDSGAQQTATVTLSIPKKDVVETTPIYTIAYNSNGGLGNCIISRHTYGVSQDLEPNYYVRPGYRFIGWATSQANANAGTVTYTNMQEVNNLSSTNDAVVNLYAVWEKDPNIWSQNENVWNSIYQGWVQIGNVWQPINTAYAQIDGEWKNIQFL